MSTVVLIQLDPKSPEAALFRDAVAAAKLDAIDLRFARDEDAIRMAPEVDVVVGLRVSEAFAAAAGRLRWAAFWGAGIERSFPPSLPARGVALTNASGVHGPNIAEHVMGMILAFTRRLQMYLRAQQATAWRHDEATSDTRFAPDELCGKTVGIIGLGRIGEAIASRARPFGVKVVAVKRDPSARHDPSVEVDALWGMGDLDRLIEASDHVCLVVPSTKETHHLMNEARFARMKSTAYFYNVGRGKAVDERALVSALEHRTIAGAGLDVFEAEPLPKESPLWGREDVILTPHVSGVTPRYFARFAPLFAANLARFVRGEPLANVYDVGRGY